jgi:hypothetical protein
MNASDAELPAAGPAIDDAGEGGGQFKQGEFGSATMALPIESLDGYEGMMPGQPNAIPAPAPIAAPTGPASGAPPRQEPSMGAPGATDGGHTQALNPEQLDGYGPQTEAPPEEAPAGPPQQGFQGGGGYMTPGNAHGLKASPEAIAEHAAQQQAASAPAGGTPYLETQMIDSSNIPPQYAVPSAAPPGGGVPYLETQAIDPAQFAAQQAQPPAEEEPGATVMLDTSSIGNNMPAPAPTPPPMTPAAAPVPAPAPPPMTPAAAPVPAPASNDMASGQNTVILQADAALQALQAHEAAQSVPEHLKGKLLIFVPETDPIMFDLLPGITTVGRGMENHLVLGDPYASRKHMFITCRSGEYTFEDSGSDNGTILNGQAGHTKVLETGDVIEIGSVQMRFIQGPVQGAHYQRPIPSPRPDSAAGTGVITGSVAGQRYSTGQLVLLVFLVLATIGLITAMILLYVNK